MEKTTLQIPCAYVNYVSPLDGMLGIHKKWEQNKTSQTTFHASCRAWKILEIQILVNKTQNFPNTNTTQKWEENKPRFF